MTSAEVKVDSKNTFAKTAVFFSLAYFALNLILDSAWKFHQLHNDYWDLLFIAKNIDFSNAHSLFNPCIPIGYTSLLHFVIKLGNEITTPLILNLFFGSLTLFAAVLFYQNLLGKLHSLISAFLVGFFPVFFYYTSQGGADPGSVMFFSLGAFLLLSQVFLRDKKRSGIFFLAGILMGTGAIFRYHVLVGAAFFVFSVFLFNVKHWKLIALSGLGVLVAYSPQFLVNFLTNHALLETKLGASNIYDLMYQINWFKTSTQQISTNALDIISTNYFLFFKKYTISFVKFFIQTGFIPCLVGIVSQRPLVKKISWTIAIFIILYFILFAATQSGRQVLLPLPLTMLCFGFLIEEVFLRIKKLKQDRIFIAKMSTYIFIAFICLVFTAKDVIHFKKNMDDVTLASNVEMYLKGLGCTNAFQTFATDYNFYFKTLPNYTGYFNGGWSRWGTYKYDQEFPEFAVDSIDTFLRDCKARKVRFLILTKDSEKLSNEIWKIYNRELSGPDIVYKKEFGRIRIFQVL